jgi:hypothetical protein
MEKGKIKGISLLTGPGDFGPAGGVRGRAAGGPIGPRKGKRHGDSVVGAGPRVRGRRG